MAQAEEQALWERVLQEEAEAEAEAAPEAEREGEWDPEALLLLEG